MKKMLFAGLCMAALATSCSNDLGTEGTHSVQLSASVSAEQTRAGFDSNADFYWQTGDKIGVITSTDDGASTKFTALSLTQGATTGSATFEGTIAGKLGDYAIYPYSDAQELKESSLSYTFPSEYTYTKVDQTFFPEAKDGNSYNPAMLANISDNNVTFKHLGGVFCIKVESMPCASGTLTLTTDQSLCGTYTTTVGASVTSELKSSSTVTDNNNVVKISFSGAEVGKPGVFYIPAPTGKYTNATVVFTESGKEALKVYAGTYNVQRTYLKVLTLSKVTVNAETVSEASTTADAKKQLETNNNVALTSEVSGTTEVEIPSVSNSTAAKTLTFKSISESSAATIQVKDANSSGSADNSVKELTVSIPNTTTNAPNAEITTPNTTVTLKGNAGTASFGTVTASTADNTLVVSSGVTIEKLVVAKGNVRINKGATVKAIEKASGNTNDVVVYYEDGATLPTSLNDGITKVGVIETEAQFAAALSNGGNYALLKDVKLTNNYGTGSSKTVVIDLNKKTLSTSFTINSWLGSDLTLKNGNISQSNTYDNSGINVHSKSTLTIDDVNYTTTLKASYNCIFVVQNAQNATLNVKNSTINGGYYAVTTNASTQPVVAQQCTINLEGSTFTAGETGALLNIPTKVTMKNCKFSGNHQGAFLRGGTYSITGCTFTLNAELEASHSENHWMKKWGAGNTGAFAALTIGNYLNTAYQYPTNITFETTDPVNRSTANVEGTYASSFPNIHICANETDGLGVTIKGLSNINTPKNTTSAYVYTLEYGTTNIVVDNVKKDPVYKGYTKSE